MKSYSALHTTDFWKLKTVNKTYGKAKVKWASNNFSSTKSTNDGHEWYPCRISYKMIYKPISKHKKILWHCIGNIFKLQGGPKVEWKAPILIFKWQPFIIVLCKKFNRYTYSETQKVNFYSLKFSQQVRILLTSQHSTEQNFNMRRFMYKFLSLEHTPTLVFFTLFLLMVPTLPWYVPITPDEMYICNCLFN